MLKIKTVHSKKNVGRQFEFPRQYIKLKNALSLTQAPMMNTPVFT